MKKRYVLSIIYLSIILFILAGCGSASETKVQEEKVDETEMEKATDKEGKEEKVAKENSKGDKEEESKNEPELIEAIETAPVYPEISFKNVNWFYGSPDLQPTGGIWVYTSETIPSGYENTIDWEVNDFLLVQINDTEYVNRSLSIQALQLIEDDVVKIVVSLKADDASDSTEKKVPRRYASVEKGQLEGKKFLVETVDGESVNVGMDVKTSVIKGETEE